MFGTQAIRLLRTKWKRPVDLAQELFAMFQDGQDLSHSGQITLQANGTKAPLKIQKPTFGGGPAIQFGDDDDDTNISFGDDGDLIISGPSITIVQSGDDEEEEDDEDTPDISTGGGGVPGYVVSGGPGDTYLVAIYPDGLSGDPENVSVKQLYIDAAATIPAGTPAIVASTGDGALKRYYMQVPVWGADV